MSYRVRYYVLGEEREVGSGTLKRAVERAKKIWNSTEGLPFAIERSGVALWQAEDYGAHDFPGGPMRRWDSFNRFAERVRLVPGN